MKDNEKLLADILNSSNEMIQVSDVQTLSMMYVNEAAKKYAGRQDASCEGHHCYEYMMGLKAQCPFCPLRQTGDQDVFETEVDNGKEVYAVKTRKIRWEGKEAFIEYAWDITEIRRSQQVYESQLRMLLTSIPNAQGIFHLDLTRDSVISINGSSKEVLGMDGLVQVDELIQSVASYVPDERDKNAFFRTFCRDSLETAYKEGKTELSRETLSYFDDGSIRPARITARIMVNPRNNHLECLLYGMDISAEWKERKKAERELKKQLAVFDALSDDYANVYMINASSEKVRILKLNGYVTTGILRKKDILYDYGKLQRQYVSERVYPLDREMMYDAISLDQVKKELRDTRQYTGNYRVLEDGEMHYYQYKYIRLENAEYIVAAFQNTDKIVEDVRRQKKIMEETQNQRKELQRAFLCLARNFRNVYLVDIYRGTAKILKLEDDPNGYMNRFRNLTFPYEEYLDQWIAGNVHPEDRKMLREALSAGHLRKVFALQKEYTGNFRVLLDGKVANYQFNLSAAEEDGKIVAGFQDIDDIIEQHLSEEKKQREKEEAYQKRLIAAKREADRANKAKTDFLLQMSHDIRTPLNGIMGMLDIADHNMDDSARHAECRVKIRESAKMLLELVNEVLDMNKLESGEVVLEEIPFCLDDIAENICTVVNKQAEKAGIEIIREETQTPWRHLIGSPVHYKRLLMNIVGNAVKYNKKNGKVFIHCSEEMVDEDTVMVNFRCRDTGIGMSEEFLSRIFEPLSQENQIIHSEYGGTGLGMTIAKKITDKMGGTIHVESKKGVGSTFAVNIPFRIDHSAGKEPVSEECQELPSLSGIKVLLAEDNELNREIERFFLTEAGAEVIEAENGQEAAEIFAGSAPYEIHAVLMDVMMPVMDGHEATRRIRKMNRPDAGQVPIIALTASAFAEDRIRAREAGMNEHLSKPLDMVQFLKTVEKYTCAYREKSRNKT